MKGGGAISLRYSTCWGRRWITLWLSRKGGAHDEANFATICSKCNARKGTRSSEQHAAIDAPRVVKGKYGEPTAWDGLASTYFMLARQSLRVLTASEKGWLRALEAWYAAPAR
jgi:hypothetical protein